MPSYFLLPGRQVLQGAKLASVGPLLKTTPACLGSSATHNSHLPSPSVLPALDLYTGQLGKTVPCKPFAWVQKKDMM